MIEYREPQDVPFEPFSYEEVFDGYIVEGLANRVEAKPPHVPVEVYPNCLLAPGSPILLVNLDGEGCLATYLAGKTERLEPELNAFVFGFIEPLTAFSLKSDDLLAMHRIGMNLTDYEYEGYLDALACFGAHGLTNSLAAFAINQNWRPWQTKYH